MWHMWDRTKMHIGFWLENLNVRDHSDHSTDGRIILKLMLRKWDERV
jgi:hypothetical protein